MTTKNKVSGLFNIDNTREEEVKAFIEEVYIEDDFLDELLETENHAFISGITAVDFVKKCYENNDYSVKDLFVDFIDEVSVIDKNEENAITGYVDFFVGELINGKGHAVNSIYDWMNDCNTVNKIANILRDMLAENNVVISMNTVYQRLVDNDIDEGDINIFFEQFAFYYFNYHNKEIMLFEINDGVVIIKKVTENQYLVLMQ